MTYFSRIDNPKALRRSMLEAAREALVLEAKQKAFSILREKRKLLTQELESHIKSLEESMKILDGFLPEKDIKKELDENVPKQQKGASKQTLTEVDRLEYTLQKIESKLAELGK